METPNLHKYFTQMLDCTILHKLFLKKIRGSVYSKLVESFTQVGAEHKINISCGRSKRYLVTARDLRISCF